jgi:putative endonuclease
MPKAWVYILICSDGSYDTGHTTNLEKRLLEHNEGRASSWTRKRSPVELVFSEQYRSRDKAYWVEQQIKRWSRGKKEAIIDNDIELLKYLSKKPAFRK